MRHASLTGTWSGAYRYPGDAGPETVFTAWIEETAGVFTGRIEEPNLFGIDDAAIVTADIDGARQGTHVRFTKFMDGSGAMHHAVVYDGVADEALTHVSGTWTIPNDWSGSFFMSRDAGVEDAVSVSTVARV